MIKNFGKTIQRDMVKEALKRTSKAGLIQKPSQGAIIAGNNDGISGVSESGRILARSLEKHGLLKGYLNLELSNNIQNIEENIPSDAAIISIMDAPLLPIGLANTKQEKYKDRFMIGVWAWELEVSPPDNWKHATELVHEVWTPSDFSRDALQHLMPGKIKTVPFPLADVPIKVEGNRNNFNIPEDKFVVLCVFNIASHFVRKNPIATINAFKTAFGNNQDVLLIIKVVSAKWFSNDMRKMMEAIGDNTNIRVMTDTLTEPKLHGLIAASDVVISLHRSEGFGIIPALATLLGKPTIATAYSGNMQYMSHETSPLISYKMIPVGFDNRRIYNIPNAEWADASVEEAADWLKKLYQDTELRLMMGESGKQYSQKALSADILLKALNTRNLLK